MLVNKAVVITNLMEKPDLYRQHFPNMIYEIDKVVQKPKCSMCINGFFIALLNDMGFQQKLAIIFEDSDINFAQDIQDYLVPVKEKSSRKTKTKVEVFWLPVEKCKEFIEGYSEDKMVRSVETTYVPSEKEGYPGKILTIIHWSSLA